MFPHLFVTTSSSLPIGGCNWKFELFLFPLYHFSATPRNTLSFAVLTTQTLHRSYLPSCVSSHSTKIKLGIFSKSSALEEDNTLPSLTTPLNLGTSIASQQFAAFTSDPSAKSAPFFLSIPRIFNRLDASICDHDFVSHGTVCPVLSANGFALKNALRCAKSNFKTFSGTCFI